MEKVRRNDLCPCGSGKKYKNCHMNSEEKKSGSNKMLVYISLFILLVVIGIIGAYYNNQGSDMPATDAQGRVWSEEHQHYH